MSPAAEQVLRSFEALEEPEKGEVLTVLLRDAGTADYPPLGDDGFVAAADHVFLALERDEEVSA